MFMRLPRQTRIAPARSFSLYTHEASQDGDFPEFDIGMAGMHKSLPLSFATLLPFRFITYEFYTYI